jgi:dihydroorotate dehydrogenase
MNFYNLVKPLFFQIDPETIHEYTMELFHKLPQIARLYSQESDEKYRLCTKNMTWNFPVGIAAGLDKNAQALEFFSKLGIGALEYGTVTLKPQAGNPRPRIFRYPKQETLRNAMGFPNDGSEKILKRVEAFNLDFPIGANIGKNKNTTIKDTPGEYAKLYEMFAPLSQYVAINVSSPNTPGLREFQSGSLLTEILQAVNAKKQKFSKPIYLKIAPDLEDEQLEEIYKVSTTNQIAGIIATNTTKIPDLGNGGVSGKMLTNKAHSIHKKLLTLNKENEDFDIIAVGGISGFDDLLNFWKAGGKLAQIYTAFVFQGPQIFVDIKNGIDGLLRDYQCQTLEELLPNLKEL